MHHRFVPSSVYMTTLLLILSLWHSYDHNSTINDDSYSPLWKKWVRHGSDRKSPKMGVTAFHLQQQQQQQEENHSDIDLDTHTVFMNETTKTYSPFCIVRYICCDLCIYYIILSFIHLLFLIYFQCGKYIQQQQKNKFMKLYLSGASCSELL